MRKVTRRRLVPSSPTRRIRLDDETTELRRRIDWLELHGHRVDMETAIENMQAELGHPSIDRLDAAHMRRAATGPLPGEVIYGDGTIVRRNIGQVLGIR